MESTKIINLIEKAKGVIKKVKVIKITIISKTIRTEENLISTKNVKAKKNIRRFAANLGSEKEKAINDKRERN